MEPKKEEFEPMEVIQRNIVNASTYIEQERTRTHGGNSWLECFLTRVNVIRMYLDEAEVMRSISPENCQRYEDRLVRLGRDIKELNGKLSRQDPPLEMQQQLLKELDIFAEPEKEESQK